MSKGTQKSIGRGKISEIMMVTREFNLHKAPIVVSAVGAANADGAIDLGAFPPGDLTYIAGSGEFEIDGSEALGLTQISATFGGNIAVGREFVKNGDIVNEERDLLPQNTLTTAVGGVSAAKRLKTSATQAGLVFLDNTAHGIFLNLEITGADIVDDTDVTLYVTGTLILVYTNLTE